MELNVNLVVTGAEIVKFTEYLKNNRKLTHVIYEMTNFYYTNFEEYNELYAQMKQAVVWNAEDLVEAYNYILKINELLVELQDNKHGSVQVLYDILYRIYKNKFDKASTEDLNESLGYNMRLSWEFKDNGEEIFNGIIKQLKLKKVSTEFVKNLIYTCFYNTGKFNNMFNLDVANSYVEYREEIIRVNQFLNSISQLNNLVSEYFKDINEMSTERLYKIVYAYLSLEVPNIDNFEVDKTVSNDGVSKDIQEIKKALYEIMEKIGTDKGNLVTNKVQDDVIETFNEPVVKFSNSENLIIEPTIVVPHGLKNLVKSME